MKHYQGLIYVALGVFLCLFSNAYAEQSQQIEQREQAIREALYIASAAQPKVLKIGLVDCITYVLVDNSEVQIKKIDPEISEENIKIAEGAFEPTLTFSGSLQDSKTEPPSVLAGSHSRTGKFDFGLSGKFTAGTEYDIDFLNTKYKDNSAYLSTNPYYQSEIAITITQPLFKDFGIPINRADILIANNNLQKSNQYLREELINVISKTKKAYYNYVLYREKFKTAQISLQRAENLLDIIQKRQEKGMASSLDLLEAKTTVAERKGVLLDIEKALKLAEDNLKFMTNLVNNPELWNAHIEPLDMPGFQKESIDLMESLKQAFEFRPDYEAAKIELKNQNIRIQVKENALLPTVDLVGSVGLNGLDETYDGALKADYKDWGMGVEISFPWGNKEAEGDFRKAKLTKEQLLIAFERLQQRIILEVRDGVRGVDITQQQIETAKERVDTETTRYEAIEKRFREGLVSAHDILEYQEDLSSAETGYIQSLIDYSTAKIELEKIVGLTLVKSNIQLEEK